MTSLFFLFFKWAMQSVCLLALSLLLFNDYSVAQEEDLVPIVTPDQLDASELEQFEPWFQTEIDPNIYPASAQFDFSTIAPMIPMPLDMFGTRKPPAVPQPSQQIQPIEDLSPIVGTDQAPKYVQKSEWALPLAQYPAAKPVQHAMMQQEARQFVESTAVPDKVLPRPAEFNLQSEIPALRPTNANSTPKPNAGSEETPARPTLPPLAIYPDPKTKTDASLIKQEPKKGEEPAETVTEPNTPTRPDSGTELEPESEPESDVPTEPETVTEPDAATESDKVDEELVPNILSEPRTTSEPDANFDESDETLLEADQPSASPSDPADALPELSQEDDTATEPPAPAQIAPAKIIPALIVPAIPALGTPGNSLSNPALQLPQSEHGTDENDPTPEQSQLRDPFFDEDAPAEDYPHKEQVPQMSAAPEYTPNATIVHDYQAADCGTGCCFQPQYYFLFEGVFLDRKGSLLTLSQNFAIDPFDYNLGGRFTYRSRPTYDNGVELSYVGLFNWDETARRTSTMNDLNSTFTPGAGLTAANFSAFNNARFHQQRFESSLHSVEYQNVKWGYDGTSYTAGLRYLLLQDEFQFDSINGAGQRGQFNLDTTNNLIGPQVGINCTRDMGNGFSFSLKGKLGLMANINNSETRLDNNGFLVANNDDNVSFSALFEVGALAHYQINSFCRLRAGYEAWLITGVATVEDNLNSTISRSTGSIVNSGDDAFLNGFTVGLELFY